MWTFERKEVKDKAVAWCVENQIEADPLGIVIALDALELLNDPAVEHGVHPTVLNVRRKLVTCPQCSLVFGVELPESHSGSVRHYVKGKNESTIHKNN